MALAGFLAATGCNENATVGDTTGIAAKEESFILAREGDVMPVGQVIISDLNITMEDGSVSVHLPDQEMDGTLSIRETSKKKVEAVGERRYRHTIIEERKTQQSTMMGAEQPAKETLNPLQGLAVIAEMDENGSWTATLEAGEATMEMEKELTKIADQMQNQSDVKVYGTVPRKVGDEWVSSDSDLLGIKDAEGSMKIKFEAVEDFQGERCAKLTGTLDLTGRLEDDGPDGMKMRLSGDFVVLRSLEHRVDLQNRLTGKMEMFGELEPQPGIKMSMKMEGPLEFDGSSVVTSGGE